MRNRNYKKIVIFFVIVAFTIAIDQGVKFYILNLAKSVNPIWKSEFIDILLVFNKGVAFSFLSFVGEYLKWIILILLILVLAILFNGKEVFGEYYVPFGLVIGSGFSNLIDRFTYNGVVDYVYWHYGFNFAIFNLADSIINVSIAYIIITYLYKEYRKSRI